MENGNVLCSIPVITEKPVAFLPRLFHYIHTIADKPTYYSEGRLRTAEAHCVFHYTLRGRGQCRNGNILRSVYPGQGFIQVINDPAAGYYYPEDSSEEWEFVCFCFEGGNSLQIVQELIRQYGSVYTVSADTPVLKELLSERRWINNALLSSFDSSRYFYSLYLQLTESITHAFDTENSFLIASVIEIINSKIRNNPSIDEIASEAGLTREHISRVFHMYTGKKLKTYIMQQQIIHACRLLKETDMTVREIALIMSFSSSSNFIRFFKDKMYMTPETFRHKGSIPYF